MDNPDLPNKDKSPSFLPKSSNKDISNSLNLLKKFYKKDKLTEQLCLNFIYLNKFNEAQKLLTKDTSSHKSLNIFLNLYQNIIKIEIKELTVKKYLLIQEKVFKKMFKDFKIVKFILVGIRLNESEGIEEIEGLDEILNEDEGVKEARVDSSLYVDPSIPSLPSSYSSTPTHPSPHSNLHKVYNYKCSSLDYQNILSSILESLLNHFDLNLIFIYYQIATLSCFLNNCKLNCREVAHETIKRELLDLSYLKILGYKNLVILYEMYKEEKILKMINEINPFVEEKYKIKKEEVKVKMSLNEEIPTEETVLIKEINESNGIVRV